MYIRSDPGGLQLHIAAQEPISIDGVVRLGEEMLQEGFSVFLDRDPKRGADRCDEAFERAAKLILRLPNPSLKPR